MSRWFVGSSSSRRSGCDARAVAPVVPARVLEPRLRLRVAPHDRGLMVARRHRGLERAELLLDRREICRSGEHVLAQRARALRRRALVVEGNSRPFLQRELAAVDRDLAGQLPEQRRLAGAVRAREREPVLALDLERHAVEKDVAGMLFAQ
jgi:hypothetical protein